MEAGRERQFEVIAGRTSERALGGAAQREYSALQEALRAAGELLGVFHQGQVALALQSQAQQPERADTPGVSTRATLEGSHPVRSQIDEVAIVCRQADGSSRRWWPRRWRYFIDPIAGLDSGDGSELHPFATIEGAVQRLEADQRRGRLDLRPGDRLHLVRREVFTPTHHERHKRRREIAAQLVTLAMTLVLVVPVLCVLGYLFYRAWPVLSPAFVWQNPEQNMTAGGIWAPLVGTFYLVVVSLAVSAPIGVLAGVYLNEYAGDNWLTRLINLAVVNLAGVPSIVHGLFGVGAFVLAAHMGRSVLAASCTLAVMSLPVIITSTREALNSVPMAFREACWNLGATRWQTIRTMVLPNSISGILTGVILQVARAAGETAPILFTGAVYYVRVADHGWESFAPYGLFDRCMALSMHLFTLCTQAQGVSEEIQYGTAVVLIGLVLVVNSASIGLRVYLRSRKKW